MLSKIFTKNLLFILASAVTAVAFYAFYIGFDIVYFQDSENYLWNSYVLRSSGYWSHGFNGYHPPGYSYFIILAQLVFTQSYLGSAIFAAFFMNALLGISFYFYLKALGLERIHALCGTILCLSNSFLYSHAMAGLNSEVLYFPLLLLSLSYYLKKNEKISPLYYLLFGLLSFVRNIHLLFLPVIFFTEKGWRRKIVSSLLFTTPFAVIVFRNLLYEKKTREIKEEFFFNFNWKLDSLSIQNIWGNSSSTILTVLILLTCVALFVFVIRENKNLFIYFFLSLTLLIVVSNLSFDSNVSFRERLLLHYYVVLLPVLILAKVKVVNGVKQKDVLLSLLMIIFLGNQWWNYKKNKLLIFQTKLSTVTSLIPVEIKNIKKGEFVISNKPAILRDIYGVLSYANFFREDMMTPYYHVKKELPKLPENFNAFLMRLTPNDSDLSVDNWAANLEACDIRSSYDYEMLETGGLYLKYKFFKVRELPSDCYSYDGQENI